MRTRSHASRRTTGSRLVLLPAALLVAACGTGGLSGDQASTASDTAALVVSITGFSGPEGVRYDPDQDVYFVSNFNGSPVGDANGFVSRVNAADGRIDSLRYMVGTAQAPLHGPRGMFIVGDTLWVVDALGVHGFLRRTGAHVAFVDLAPLRPGFPNDIAQGPDGALFVTDTDSGRVYRLSGGRAEVAGSGQGFGHPNGITWSAARQTFVLAPWGGDRTVRYWTPGSPAPQDSTVMATGGDFDGIETVGTDLLIAGQVDSSIRVVSDTARAPLIRTAGQPADIGIDTRRQRIAIPFVSLNRVDVYTVPDGR